MKMYRLKWLLFAASVVSSCLSRGDATIPALAENLFATSNLWDVSIATYEAGVMECVSAMRGSTACNETFVDWYTQLSFYDETPNQSKGGEWILEKGLMLSRYARLSAVATSTNAWLAVAKCLGRMKVKKRLLMDERSTNALSNMNAVASSEWNSLLYERAAALHAIRNSCIGIDKAIPLLEDAVTNGFPRAILPLLSDDMQREVVSNIIESAQTAGPLFNFSND